MIVDMNKSQLKEEIVSMLQQQHNITLDAVNQAVASATDKETIPEHKYDTLALEAAYLAHGQAMRVTESEERIRQFLALDLPQNPDQVTLGCLVALRDENASLHWFFVSPVSGGLKVNWQGLSIILVTFQSPLGKALRDKELGDDVEYLVGNETKYYQVETIF